MLLKRICTAAILAGIATTFAFAQEKRTVAVGDLNISYGDVGQGAPIVLVHGGGLTSRMWNGFAAVASEKHRVLTPDTRNHGGTNNPSGEFSYELAADDLAGFIEELGLESPVLMGCSDGGIIVQQLLLEHPGLTSAAVICAASNKVAADDQYMSGMRAFYGYDGRGELPDEVLDTLESKWPKFAGRLKKLHQTTEEPDRWRSLHKLAWPVWTRSRVTPLDDYAAVDVPTLVIIGQNDDFFLAEDALALSRALPKGEIAIIAGASHGIHRQRPELFSMTVLNFIERSLGQ